MSSASEAVITRFGGPGFMTTENVQAMARVSKRTVGPACGMSSAGKASAIASASSPPACSTSRRSAVPVKKSRRVAEGSGGRGHDSFRRRGEVSTIIGIRARGVPERRAATRHSRGGAGLMGGSNALAPFTRTFRL